MPNKIDASGKTNVQLPLPAIQYVFNVHFDNGQHDVASYLRKPTYRIKISMIATSRIILAVASLLDSGADLNLIYNDFLPPVWKQSIKSIKSTQLRTTNHEIVNLEGIVALFICICNLRRGAWFGTVENLTVDVLLGTPFIDQCLRRIFHTNCKIGPCPLKPVAIISTKTTIKSFVADDTVFNRM